MLPLGELDVLAIPAYVIKFVIIRNISEHCDPWRRAWLRRTAEVIRFYLLQYDINKFCVIYNYSHLYSRTFLDICTDYFIYHIHS